MQELQQFINDLKNGLRHVVINDCYGGFGLSDRAMAEYKKLAGITAPDFYESEIARDDPYLVKIVKEMGSSANSRHSNLKIVSIPGDVDWFIQEYDGLEWVAEKHRTWK